MAVGDIGALGPGQVPTDVRALSAQIALTNAKILAAALHPGEILTARVGATLGDGNVSLTVRGQTLIANSAATLLPDSLVKLLVQSAGDQPVLRILTNTPPDPRVSTSTPTSRAATLGLPATPLATTVLAAFEKAGAPLDPTRLKEAVAQVQNLPPAQVPQRLQAFALLAQAGLPTTPPFIALAERSATGVLPNPAAAVAQVQQAVSTLGAQLPASPIAGRPPALGLQPPATSGQPPAPSSQPPSAVVPPPSPAPASAGAPATTSPVTAAPTTTPAPVSPAAPVVPSPVVSSPTATTTSPPLASGPPVPAGVAPPSAFVIPVMPFTHTLAGTLLPDLARGGATAVLQALALAGVRPRETGEMVATKAEPTLLHRLEVPVEEISPIRAGLDSSRQPPQQPLEAAMVHVMREQAAETVVKPQALVDYDIVLGLPLQVMGQPLPARLAVAERQTSAGTATFLRVDAELTHLGPLSVRISGIENGPMAITVLAVGAALGALTEALPDLNDSLRALGLAAGVRVADLSEDSTHG